MRAYVDESVHLIGAPSMYVLASVVVQHQEADEVRAVLRDSRGNRRNRFHWVNEEQVDREALAKTVGALDLFSVVAVCSPIDNKRQERARRLCLTQLLWELESRGVHDVLLESRGAQDLKDQEHISNRQLPRPAGPRLAYGFGSPTAEPLLWLPDLVAGAVAYNQAGRIQGTNCLTLLGTAVTIINADEGT